MSSLTFAEKRHIEDYFGMETGYVLNFSDRTFQAFVFDAINIDIYGGDYEDHGSSKAKHMRCFWEKEDDPIVGRLLKELVEYALDLAEIKAERCFEDKDPKDSISYKKSWQAIQRLLGNNIQPNGEEITEDDFLKQTFKEIQFDICSLSLPITKPIFHSIRNATAKALRISFSYVRHRDAGH